MSPKNPLLTAGLTALGLLGFAATPAPAQDRPAAPVGSATAQAPSPAPTVLLKSNGDILRGTIVEEDERYVVRQYGNEIPVPKGLVERLFGSLEEVYRYRLSSVPDRDPDERLKLARWCLSRGMKAEAKAELQAVLALSPDARVAEAMLASLEAEEARLAARPRVDPGLARTGAEVVEQPGVASAAPAGDPGEMDPSVLRAARRELGVKGYPVIFDLPPALAVKRADQFARVIHPLLQASCVRCHNEQYAGRFQLIEQKSRKGLNGEMLRANLDATLQLVDPEHLSRSELLSIALVPHGREPNKRPIFRGSNDARFQVLAAWVGGLRAPGRRAAEASSPSRFGGAPAVPTAPAGAGFASERGARPGGPSVTPVQLPDPVRPLDLNDAGRVRVDNKSLPPVRYVPGRGMVAESAPPAAEEFPVPFAVGGPPPTLKPVPPGAPSPIPLPSSPPAPAVGAGAPAALPDLPVSATPDAAAALPAPAAKPKKPVKLDPALLERALMNRNSQR